MCPGPNSSQAEHGFLAPPPPQDLTWVGLDCSLGSAAHVKQCFQEKSWVPLIVIAPDVRLPPRALKLNFKLQVVKGSAEWIKCKLFLIKSTNPVVGVFVNTCCGAQCLIAWLWSWFVYINHFFHCMDIMSILIQTKYGQVEVVGVHFCKEQCL